MKCNKVKNPCKICFQPVTKKNGIQCQGACQKWAHFKCLNYTPGKIQDIKAGVIKVTCPCPDCNTTVPKEILADPPFTCTNTQCPANKMPVCNSIDCPSSVGNPNVYPPQFESSPTPSSERCSPPRSPCPPPKPPPCPPPRSPPCPPPKSPPCPSPPRRTRSPSLKSPCPSPPLAKRNCPSPCPPVCPPNCPSWQKVKKPKKPCSPKQSQSCSELSKESSSARHFDRMRPISSDSKIKTTCVDQKMLFSAIENLCNTVGQLSHQLRDLMCKIQANS